MSRHVLPVLIGTFLALVAATVWVPYSFEILWTDSGKVTRVLGWQVVWSPETNASPVLPRWTVESSVGGVLWSWVLVEHVVIVVLGGTLLTWVVRRERRRRAEAGAVAG